VPPKREIKWERFLINFPNVVSDELRGKRFPLVSGFGQVNVCVEQGALPECNGRIDVAWITDTTVHLVEIKKTAVTERTLRQFLRYRDAVQTRYPTHRICGYLVGKHCSTKRELEKNIGEQPIKILLLGVNIPLPNEVIECPNPECKAGLRSGSLTCRYCGVTL
jgi:hypothetical protein